MKKILFPDSDERRELCRRPLLKQADLRTKIRGILKAIKSQGDKALLEYTKLFDGVSLETFMVQKREFEEARKLVPLKLKEAIDIARMNIELFHRSQLVEEKIVETRPGVKCWRKMLPIEKVGLYVPGGTAPLFSTLLMLAIPAQLAGCDKIIVCSPPSKDGKMNPIIVHVAESLGIKNLYKLGGPQAIAAMAYGTESIPKVFKICGPGNQYVTAAKQIVREDALVEIDFVAGPSEVFVVADDSCPIPFIAADLIAQAEHNSDSQVILASNSEPLVDRVLKELTKQLENLPRKAIAEQSFLHSSAVVLKNLDEAIGLSNEYAPEHLIIAAQNAETLASKVKNAGSVFLGYYSPEAAGDYASGTNHSLPTAGYANLSGGVSLDTFLKKTTFQKLTRRGLSSIAPAICEMAEAEGLNGHSRSVKIRFDGEISDDF